MQINLLEYFNKNFELGFQNNCFVDDGSNRYSFSDANLDSNLIQNLLIEKGVGLAKPIGVFMPKSYATVVSNLAIIKTGNFYTNFDISTPSPRLLALVSNLELELVVTTPESKDLLAKLIGDSVEILVIDLINLRENSSNPELDNYFNFVEVLDVDPVCLVNTSGSTGVPKSVAMSHKNVIDFIDWVLENFDFNESDVFGSLSPFYFDIYTLELWVAIARGCTISLLPEKLAAFPAALMEEMANRQITFMFWVPTVMVNIANMGLLESHRIPSLRRVFFAGEVFPTRHLNLWRNAYKSVQFVNLYGPIEITVDCTFYIVEGDFRDDEPIPIGVPCKNSGVVILDEHNQLISSETPGVLGELCIRGTSLALGYYNNHEQTEKAFTQNPLVKSYPDKIYRTGDLVYWNDFGQLVFAGRKDFQIKHLGYRIELGEIETAVTAVPEIGNACVVYDQSEKTIVLFYETLSEITPVNIRAQLASKLPKYMIPTRYECRELLPRNPNGKIDRQKLKLEI